MGRGEYGLMTTPIATSLTFDGNIVSFGFALQRFYQSINGLVLLVGCIDKALGGFAF